MRFLSTYESSDLSLRVVLFFCFIVGCYIRRRDKGFKGREKIFGRFFFRRGRGEEILNFSCFFRRREESWVFGGARVAVRAKSLVRVFG